MDFKPDFEIIVPAPPADPPSRTTITVISDVPPTLEEAHGDEEARLKSPAPVNIIASQICGHEIVGNVLILTDSARWE